MQHLKRSRQRTALWLAPAVAVLVLLGACGTDGEQTSTDGTSASATTEPVMVLSAEEVGPSAFTPPVDTAPLDGAPTGACDKQALINELEARPDAHREWAEVLSIPEVQVASYINTLEPGILGGDTRMTNHGLSDDGQAFPIQSTLTAGTAVLVDTSDGSQKPVTRCICGNPLLPPVYPTATTTTYYEGTTTTTYYEGTTTTTYYEGTTTTTGRGPFSPTPSVPPNIEADPGD